MKRVLLVAVALFATLAPAHVGSPDIFFEGEAGPYRVFVAIQPPKAIPGLAQVSVRVPTSGIREVRVTSMPLEGLGAEHAPAAETAQRAARDPQHFMASLWLMTAGSWQARLELDGARGEGHLSVPVAALPTSTATMTPGFAATLLALMSFLIVSAVRIAAAAGREGLLEPGARPGRADLRRSRSWQLAAAGAIAAILVGGRSWWLEEERAYGRILYKPLALKPRLDDGRTLSLELVDPGWLKSRGIDDLVPDHGHLMHLFVVRVPELDRMFHLHPERVGAGRFVHTLPPMPAGRYQLFADVVHQTGLAETLVTELDLPEVAGHPLEGDDSAGLAPRLGTRVARPTSPLSGGARLVWVRDEGRIRAREPTSFLFKVEGASGRELAELEPYMGMLGHAVFLKEDRSVFTHVHPSGSVAMAALSIAQASSRAEQAAPAHSHGARPIRASRVTFPYAFPNGGWYRIFVQVKRGGAVETASFDVEVDPPSGDSADLP